jgi:hypothetical protein
MEPFVFIVGCARSGTTLLQRIVDAHPQVAVTPELHWITDSFRKEPWLDPESRVTPDQVAGLVGHKRFRQLEFTREEFEGLLPPGEPVPYAPFLEALFALYGHHKGKPLVGNKTPAYVQRVATLHAIWPRAKFVHLIRDGRDVALSVLSWNHANRTAGKYATWAEDPVTTTALWWRRKVLSGREGGRLLAPDLYYELCYERLVAHPDEECASLCAFLGVRDEPAMLRFHEGRTRHDPGMKAKKPWLPITPGLRDWRRQMDPDAVNRFEAAAGDLLDDLGYPRAYPHPSAEALRHATTIANAFARAVPSPPGALSGVR